jgi:phosphatidate cytidylyltransferase
MSEFLTRTISGVVYAILLVGSLYYQPSLLVILFLFGIISLIEFSKLIHLKSIIQYIIFILFYGVFSYFSSQHSTVSGVDESIQILLVITIFVNLILVKDLFTTRKIPLVGSKRFIITSFYLSTGFVFMIQIAHYNNEFTPLLLLGSLILIWVNDSAAYLVGKNFGKQKLFPSISPKKTVEGFLGGLLFACIASYFIASLTGTLKFNSWLILAIIVSVLGTFGDLIESKFKRQAGVKDSGIIMPGHGGLLDRLDSLIFTAPFIYLFLRIS